LAVGKGEGEKRSDIPQRDEINGRDEKEMDGKKIENNIEFRCNSQQKKNERKGKINVQRLKRKRDF
jgi:hypothetical protein